MTFSILRSVVNVGHVRKATCPRSQIDGVLLMLVSTKRDLLMFSKGRIAVNVGLILKRICWSSRTDGRLVVLVLSGRDLLMLRINGVLLSSVSGFVDALGPTECC